MQATEIKSLLKSFISPARYHPPFYFDRRALNTPLTRKYKNACRKTEISLQAEQFVKRTFLFPHYTF